MKSDSIDMFTLLKLVDDIKSYMTEGETLGIKQISLLLVLLKYEDMSVTEIANRMNVSPPSVSALTEKLTKKDLIKRTYNNQDRRVVTIRLTEKGMLLARELQCKQENIIRNLETFLTKEEVDIFNNLLKKMNGL